MNNMEKLGEFLRVVNDNVFIIIFLLMIVGLIVSGIVETFKWIINKFKKS